MRFELFGGQGHIEVVDTATMGNRGEHAGDWAVVDAARVSFGRKASDFPFERNEKLARELWDNTDMSPFAHLVFQLHVRVPIHIGLSWFLFPHADYNEISGRYTADVASLDRCFIPQDMPDGLKELLNDDFEASHAMYQSLYSREGFERGEKQVAKELARSVLPYSFFTEFRMTVTLRKLVHFLQMFAAHPDFGEIRQALFSIVEAHAPICGKGFSEFLADVSQKKTYQNAEPYSFNSDSGGILGDTTSALRLLKSDGSDYDLAYSARLARGYRGSDFSVIKELIHGSRRDDLPPELTEIRMRFGITVPIYIFRQMYRHKRAAWYGLAIDPHRFFIPRAWRAQVKGSRYAYSEFSDDENARITERVERFTEERSAHYQAALEESKNRSHAERFLPYMFYVSVVRTGDGIDLFNMMNMRCDAHAQKEHRLYAIRMARHFAARYPLTFIAWYEEYWNGTSPEIDRIYNDMTAD